ncbi:unnamed protein product, partial [Rotaria magnacalcarata]
KKVQYQRIFDDESTSVISSNSDSVDMLDLMLLNNTRTMLNGQELDDNIHGGHFRNEDNF